MDWKTVTYTHRDLARNLFCPYGVTEDHKCAADRCFGWVRMSEDSCGYDESGDEKNEDYGRCARINSKES